MLKQKTYAFDLISNKTKSVLWMSALHNLHRHKLASNVFLFSQIFQDYQIV